MENFSSRGWTVPARGKSSQEIMFNSRNQIRGQSGLLTVPVWMFISLSVTSKKSPNVYNSCPKMILLQKLKILTSLQKLP